MIEWIVLGVVLLFSLRYLWRYIRRALGLGGQQAACSACSGCSTGSCDADQKTVSFKR